MLVLLSLLHRTRHFLRPTQPPLVLELGVGPGLNRTPFL